MQRDFMNDYRDVLMTDGMAEGEDEDIDYFAPMQMAEKAYNTLWCKNELESRRSVSHFERQFRHAKEIDGGTFYYLNQNNNEQEEKNAIKQLMSKAKRDNLSDEYKDIIDAAIIDYEQYTKIKGNYTQTQSYPVVQRDPHISFRLSDFLRFGGGLGVSGVCHGLSLRIETKSLPRLVLLHLILPSTLLLQLAPRFIQIFFWCPSVASRAAVLLPHAGHQTRGPPITFRTDMAINFLG
jgi:hypothetical protein